MKIQELFEDIFLQGDKKLMLGMPSAKDTKQRASGSDFISTARPRLPHETSSDSRTGGVPVYTPYLYKSNKTITDMLTTIKGKGPFEVDERALNHFIADTASYMKQALGRKIKPTLIVYPKSSSELTKKFVDKLKDGFPDATVIDDAFVKNVISLTGDDKQDRATVGALIDVYHPNFETLSDDTVDALEKRLLSLLKQQGEGVIPIKKIYKPLAKFIKGFIKPEEKLWPNLKGANVLIVDDILSSGTTMREMARICKERGAEAVSGMTIFRSTSQND